MSWEQAEEVKEGSATTAFADYGLPTPIVTALSGKGIETPFPIQAATIPDALAGKDILARAQTGSGKTLGFGLPMLARLDQGERGRHPRGVILAPTRELAVQVADELAPMAANLGLRMVLVAGGMGFGPQLKAFRKGVDIVVATPGRLIDLMEQGEADLSHVEMLVLDEADHMSDLGFLPAVTQVMESVKEDAQKLLFSATLDDAVSRIVKKFLHNPVTHQVDENRASVTTMTHVVWHVETREKVQIAAKLAHRPGRTLVFVRTQRGADRIAQDFQESGVLAAALHGGLTQGQRVRTLNAFKNSTLPVLIATDVAARGIHVDDVSLVLQYDPPANEKDYLHRAGRTARAGRDGLVASLVQQSQRRSVQRMMRMAGLDVEPRRVRLDDEELLEFAASARVASEAVAAVIVVVVAAVAEATVATAADVAAVATKNVE
ncbi:transporter [Platysternon megacephalum]|uniref:RNA helicase n=1 Tax=Platysternon megacephalum TaxID=55544 RepID=A0A4D9DK33_9SAUR|nr:transporter [Platysternon megacephalum]